MSFLDRFFKTEAKPVEIVQGTVKANTNASLNRNLSRLITLYKAQEDGDTRSEIVAEIKARVQACTDLGHDAPNNLQSAFDLQKKVIK
jgi:hypothetical protein